MNGQARYEILTGGLHCEWDMTGLNKSLRTWLPRQLNFISVHTHTSSKCQLHVRFTGHSRTVSPQHAPYLTSCCPSGTLSFLLWQTWWIPIQKKVIDKLMEQSPWEVNSSSSNQEIPCILWNPKVHCHVHKGHCSLSSVRSSLHAPSKTHFHIILPSVLRYF